MKKTLFSVLIILLILAIITLTSCPSSKEQEELKAAMAPFESSEQIVFISERDLHVGSNVTPLQEIKYKGERCYMIRLEANGMYAYAADSNTDLEINVVYVDFATMETTFIKRLVLPERVEDSNFINGVFYFRMIDYDTENHSSFYLLYDTETDLVSIAKPSNHEEYYPMPDIFDDHHFNFDRFSLTIRESTSKLGFPVKNGFYITDNETGTTKILDDSLLDTCPEGKIISSFGGSLYERCAYEKNGYVYLLFIKYFAIREDCFVMKYDFDTHSLEYYATIWNAFTDDTKPYMVIPDWE